VVLALSATTVGVVHWWKNWPAKHFGVVEKGVLYRSGQPEGNEWELLRDHYGIKTVLNLRGESIHSPWWQEEHAFCEANGIRCVDVAVGAERLTEEQLKEIMEITTDPSQQPVLVHCEVGKRRTGVVVAAYRIMVEGWSATKAISDAERYRKHLTCYAGYLSELEQRRAQADKTM